MPETARALLVVDVQPTFCEGGELPVAGGDAVADAIAGWIRDARDRYRMLATSQDWHVDPGSHFSADPDFRDSWPPHGIAGTPNADLHPHVAAALTRSADVSVRKGQHQAAYSAFEGTDEHGATLLHGLRAHAVTDLDVCGIAESHCVKATVLDALAAGFRVRLLTDLTVAVTAELGAAARAEMREAGAEPMTSAQAHAQFDEDPSPAS